MNDKFRRTIAYRLIGLLALVVTGLPAMVALGAIPVGGVKEFDVIFSPVVTLGNGRHEFLLRRRIREPPDGHFSVTKTVDPPGFWLGLDLRGLPP